MLNLVQLQTLTVVLKFGSFADAARHLGYTPSAVSQQISALERQLKVTLFERDAHSIRATPAAEEIAARSAPALGALQGLEDEIERIQTGSVGRLRIGSFPTASEQILPAALSRLRRDRPNVEVHLDEDEPTNLISMLERREIDVALVYRYRAVSPRWPQSVHLSPVLSEDLLLIRPSSQSSTKADPAGALNEDAVSLSAYDEATWITTREDTSGAATMRHLCRSAGFEPMVSYRSNNYAVIQGLVVTGLGSAIIPALAFKHSKGIDASPLPDSVARREVLIASAPSTPRELVAVFENAVRKSAERLAGPELGVRLMSRRRPVGAATSATP